MPHILRRHRKTVTTETWTIVWTGDEMPPFPVGEEPPGLPPPDRPTPPNDDSTTQPSSAETTQP